MRVLLVDDDEGFRATVRHLLTRRARSVRIEEAADGEEALRIVEGHPPDVVLMDITMPRMNGLEATRRLKARWPDLPVIVLTVHDDPVYERTARAAGASAYLLKKRAGTALWPALDPIAARSGGAGAGPALAVAGAPVAPPPRGIARGGTRQHPRWAFGDQPDWQAAPGPV
jgi:DNA-binding NarL/FixJ family response regulator